MRKPKIVFLDARIVGFTANLSQLSKLGEVIYYPVTSREEIILHIGDAEIIISNKVLIDKTIMTPHLAWASDESRERLIDGIIENITDYIHETDK